MAGQGILVALSGGADSVALLHLLHATQAELGVRVCAAHVHHHVRGAAADEDAAFCERLCARLGVRFELLHLTAPRPVGSSPEAFMRAERYRLLETARVRLGCTVVVTAHTLDDQAETVLHRVLRGAGTRGAAGIRPRHGRVVRPLLWSRRTDLRAMLTERGETWREDATNQSPDQPRALLRRRVLPLLESCFPGSAAHLAILAARLAEDDEELSDLLSGIAVYPAVGSPAPVAGVSQLKGALRRRWVLELAGQLPRTGALTSTQVDLVEGLLLTGVPAAVDLGGRWVLRRHGAWLHLSPPPCPPFAPVAARLGESNRLPGGFQVALGVGAGQSAGVVHRALLHPRVGNPGAVWRPLVPGERWPASRGRCVKALAGLGVPPEWRKAWPVLEVNGTMIWLPGVGVAPGWGGDPPSGIQAQVEEPWTRQNR